MRVIRDLVVWVGISICLSLPAWAGDLPKGMKPGTPEAWTYIKAYNFALQHEAAGGPQYGEDEARKFASVVVNEKLDLKAIQQGFYHYWNSTTDKGGGKL